MSQNIQCIEVEGIGINESVPVPIILNGTFFKIVKREESNNIQAKCVKCNKILRGRLNATTNFRNHLKVKGHSLQEYENYMKTNFLHPKKRTAPTSDKKDTKKLKQTTINKTDHYADQQNADELIINYIVQTMSPMTTVEHQDFINLIQGVNKLKTSVRVLTRKTLSNKIDEKYNCIINNLKDTLMGVKYTCTTADIWSTSRRSYMGMTVHWINNKYERTSAALACKRFKGSHTYDKIANMITDIHNEFLDKTKTTIVKTVTDNGSNVVKAFRISEENKTAQTSSRATTSQDSYFEANLLGHLLNDKSLKNVLEIVNEDDLDEDEDDEMLLVPISETIQLVDPEESHDTDILLPHHQRCASHILNLITTNDIKQAYTKNTNSIYSRLHDSSFKKCSAIWNLTARSPKACEVYHQITDRQPTSPCVTRWNSTFDCLEKLLTIKENLGTLCNELQLPKFKESEIEFLEEYVEIVRPFAEALDKLQGSKNTFFGELLPQLFRLKKILQSFQQRKFRFCSCLVNILFESLWHRFSDYLNLTSSVNDAIIATVAHPFFKLRWVPKENKSQVKDIFIHEIKDLLKEKSPLRHKEDSQHLSDTFFMFESDDGSGSGSDTSNSNNSGQLQALQYLQNESTDLTMLDQYPEIKKIFMKYNTPLPSSAPVERLFSYAGMIMRPKRRSMADETFEKLLIIKANSVFSNLKYDI